MLSVQDVFDLIIHGIIFSYAIYYLCKEEKTNIVLFICFTILFSLNKYICLFFISFDFYFIISHILLSFILCYCINKQIDILSLFYSLSICLSYYCSLVFHQIIQTICFHYSLNISPTVIILLSEIIFLFFILIIIKNIHKISLEVTENKYLFISILIIILILFIIILKMLSRNSNLRFDIYLLLILIISLAFISLALFIYVSHLQRQKFEESLTNQELILKEKTYYQIERSVQNLSSLRHDMLYILTHIQHLNNQQNNDIDCFIDKQIEHMKANDKPILTGNQTLNYIIFENMSYMRKHHIDFICNQCYEDVPIQKIDFYTIMTSLLETAIYNIPDNTQIHLKHGYIANNYYIKISAYSYFQIDSQELKIIQSIVSKYHGNIYITHENQFTEFNLFI